MKTIARWLRALADKIDPLGGGGPKPPDPR